MDQNENIPKKLGYWPSIAYYAVKFKCIEYNVLQVVEMD